ncbi:hypothetical protein [Sphaerochaeta halotolerans]|uniref:hypothetical protein n=1 Tax=Sphaerochaeta halotolerans TaxID=2293840 RepID=UPI00136E24C4|nr:hypothetical protein [Sphaerochaeta halotolerans]MXI86670.1 hypothetical protein [Sphaerochaeta halotolerans]
MNRIFNELLQKAEIELFPSEIVLHFPTGFDLCKCDGLQPLFSSGGCQINDEIYSGPWRGISNETVEINFSKSKLRKHNIVVCKSIEDYATLELGVHNYFGFLKEDHLTIILDKNGNLSTDENIPQQIADVENCFLLFCKIWNLADLRNGETAYFLLEEPLEISKFIFDNKLVHTLQTKHTVFENFFSESDGEKKGCFKRQLLKFLQPEKPENRMSILFTRFDEIYQNTVLAFQRLCALKGEDKLAIQLEKDSLDLLERSKIILESIKSEILVLATNAIGFSSLDFSNVFSIKNGIVLFVLLLMNIVYTIVLTNGKTTLSQLIVETQKHEKTLIKGNPESSKDEIEKTYKEFKEGLCKINREFIVCIILLWLPWFIVIILFLTNHFCNWPIFTDIGYIPG